MENKKFYINVMNRAQASWEGIHELEDALGGVMIDCDITKFLNKVDDISAYILGLDEPCDAYYETFWELMNENFTSINGDVDIWTWEEFYDYWHKENN